MRVFTIGFGSASGGDLNATCARQFLGREPPAGSAAVGVAVAVAAGAASAAASTRTR